MSWIFEMLVSIEGVDPPHCYIVKPNGDRELTFQTHNFSEKISHTIR